MIIVLLAVSAIVALPIYEDNESLVKMEMTNRVIQYDIARYCNVTIPFPTRRLHERQRAFGVTCYCFLKCKRYIAKNLQPSKPDGLRSVLDYAMQCMEDCWNLFVILYLTSNEDPKYTYPLDQKIREY